jgi:hypothetical protein
MNGSDVNFIKNNKNEESLSGEINVQKREFNVKKKGHDDRKRTTRYECFSSPPRENLKGSFCSGVRGTQDRSEIWGHPGS